MYDLSVPKFPGGMKGMAVCRTLLNDDSQTWKSLWTVINSNFYSAKEITGQKV